MNAAAVGATFGSGIPKGLLFSFSGVCWARGQGKGAAAGYT